MKCICLIVAVLLLTIPALARDPDGRWAQSPNADWFKSKKSPKTGIGCCSISDAVLVDEDIRYDEQGIGHYWAQWKGSGGYLLVPDEVVIHEPNFNGSPVVWWAYSNDGSERTISITCYVPGAKL
jgi:hypothetical protein